ncbi:DUF3857 domain-containing protein [Dyadobacter sp. LJ53]|uniref:DUF3857 domain-containing protein n=1 Tax=Dyadobacter chenwenxiniae TaxID=2906456 RepID=UPI001F33D234|nr:DUF3857 domain-containing protein [Dyadobacter chenwenxiniae]MCF0053194.1 DUF3857 domain-containing protein [Dyadobacter chenwenxiniae]
MTKGIRSLCFLILLNLPVFDIFAQNDFDIARINPEILNKADAVVRLDETLWDLESKGEAHYSKNKVITILNEKGEDALAHMVVAYDKFTKIIDFEAKIFDSKGVQLKKMKSSEMVDYGYGVAEDIISDSRLKLADFGKKNYSYPYTVQFVFETRDRNLMSFPAWTPVSDVNVAVELARYSIRKPAGYDISYREYNSIPPVVKSKTAKGAEVYQWTVKNYFRVKEIDLYPLPLAESTPMVIAAPSEFEVQNYSGNFKSWQDLGKFYYTLNSGRDELLPATVAEIRSLVADAKSDRDKVEKIYKWVQGRSRYVSIQLGIGGWQTIDAKTVASKGFGDCKALSNFTVAALRQVGITSYNALVKAGDDPTMKADFPSNQFNHVIACAVIKTDTIWLECTSQTTTANFMGTFTGSRHALLITPEGGKLVPTPVYKSHQNTRKSRANVSLDEVGNGKVEVHTLYAGLQQESRNSVFHNGNKEEQKKWLMNHINLPSLDLQQFELLEGRETEPTITEKLSLNVRNCATKTGTRLFIKPTLLSRGFELPATTERTTDFYLPGSVYDFTDSDTVSYIIPGNYKLETTLPSFQIESVFGSYESKTVFENNKLVCARKVVMNGGRYNAKDFPAWIDFLKKVRKADRAQVVFVENKP